MGTQAHSPTSSFEVTVKATVCSTGGYIGSPEEKAAIMAAESLFILSPHLTVGDLQSPKLFSLHRVCVKNRFRAAVDLDSAVIQTGTKVWEESAIAIAETANRCVNYPVEEISRDAVHLRSGVRTVDWSPRGMDKFGRVVMTVLTLDGRASIFAPKGANNWQEVVDLTTAWQGFYIAHGRMAKNHSKAMDERPVFNLGSVKDVHENTLSCDDIADYIDAVEDICMVSATWGQLVRKPQVETPKSDMGPKPTIPSSVVNEFGSKGTKPIGVLVLLSRSGAISFWGVNTPLLTASSLFLLRVDYKYAPTRRRCGVPAPGRAVYIKLCDLDASNAMLVVGLTNGEVLGLIHTYRCGLDGCFSVRMTETLSLCDRPVCAVPMVAGAWSFRNGLFCLGYGRHLLLACVKLFVSEHTLQSRFYDQRGAAIPTYQVEHSMWTKPPCLLGLITGVRIDDGKVYITTLDGYLACKDVSQMNTTDADWQILWSTSLCPISNDVHWEFHGLNISANGVFITFLEQPVNYLDAARQLKLARLLPQVRFLSFWSDSRLLELVFNPKLPVHRKIDGLLALAQRWTSASDAPSPLVQRCVDELGFSISAPTLPQSWLDQPLTMLHVYRFVISLMTGDTNTDTAAHASRWLSLMDCLLQQRHLDRCFRTFLNNQVTRQATDCLLVVRMATVLTEFWKCFGQSDENSEIGYQCFIESLPRTVEQASKLARQLYVHRFKLPENDIMTELQPCYVCSERVIPDVSFAKCSRNHSIPRCMQTLDPCCDVAFRRCSLCGRIAVEIPSQDRPSVWRMGVVHSMCIFCDLTLIWEDF